MNPEKALKRLVVSQTRLKLIQSFFYFPDQTYYVRQMTRLVEEEINSVRRELANLKAAGILLSEWRASRLFYWVDQKHLFFQDLLSLVLKTKGLGKEIIESRQRLGQIKAVIFSSAFARNLPRQDDRIDVLVVGSVVLPELGALVVKEEKLRDREINYTVMDEKEFRLRKEGRDPFLYQILLSGRVMIIGSEQELLD
ncbi:MAG: hypothetical protein ABID04_01605 [Patescibacteria group bacterium]